MKLTIDSEALKLARLEKGLSRAQLAEKTGVSRRRIEGLEVSNDGVRPETVQALAKALGKEIADISNIVTEVAS